MARFLFAGTVLAVLALVGCGGGGGGTVTPSGYSATPTPAVTATPTPVSTPASTPQLGKVGSGTVFVGQNGHTLYVFGADTANTSNCTDASGCTGVWPPYAAPPGTTAPGSTSFGIITRSDGTLQWTYGTAPLYEYTGDSAAGTANGNGINAFGGLWSAAAPAASPLPTNTPYAIHR